MRSTRVTPCHRPRPGAVVRGTATTDAWDWQLRARCRGLPAEIFFTGDDDRGLRRVAHEQAAKQICLGCPVQRECLFHAMESGEAYGIWGATTPKERVALQQARTSDARGLSAARSKEDHGNRVAGLILID